MSKLVDMIALRDFPLAEGPNQAVRRVTEGSEFQVTEGRAQKFIDAGKGRRANHPQTQPDQGIKGA